MRHYAPRICFFLSGLCSLVFHAGVNIRAQGAIAFLLGAACLLEIIAEPGSRPKVSPKVLALAAGLFIFLGATLVPWPGSWASWFAPGQAALLSELKGVHPRLLRLSMAPVATWQACFMLMGAAGVIWLSWRWSSGHSYRRAFSIFVVLLGGISIALLAMDDPALGGHSWGVFSNRNRFSNYADLCAIFSVGVFLGNCFPGRDQKKHPLSGILALVMGLLCVISSAATTSRGGLISLAAGMMAFSWFRGRKRRFGTPMKALILIMMLGSALLLAYGRNSIKRVERLTHHEQFLSGEERLQIWHDGWKMSMAMRGRGIGVGAFETVFPAFQNSIGERRPVYVENEYLQTWIEWGGLGCLLWLLLGTWVVGKARHDLRNHPRDWQIGAWSALVAMGVHSGVDFPLHIPANAWLACAILGMALAGKGEKDREGKLRIPSAPARPRPGGHSAIPTSFDSFGLILMGGVLIAAPIFAIRSLERSGFHKIETLLANGDFKMAFQKSRESMESWPFYWRAHYLAGYSAAGLPNMSKETCKDFQNAQRLAQVDSRISYQAGGLFFPRYPYTGIEFFERSLAVSNEPNPLFRTLLEESRTQGGDMMKLAPLALTKPERWRMVWEFMVNKKFPKVDSQEWLEKGMKQWLDDPGQRLQILEPLIEGGVSQRVIEAFQTHPPASDAERYWEARAKEGVEDWNSAAREYAELWKSLQGEAPRFKSSIELSEMNDRLAILNPDDLDLQRRMAETLMAHSKYGDALHFWERLARHDPHDAEAAFGRAFCLHATRRVREAAAAWRGMAEEKLKIRN